MARVDASAMERPAMALMVFTVTIMDRKGPAEAGHSI
jgi:hypothetical protein